MSEQPMYKRVLLKISGEALSGGTGFGINNDVVNEISLGIKKLNDVGVEVAVVVGGGNFWRGRTTLPFSRCLTALLLIYGSATLFISIPV